MKKNWFRKALASLGFLLLLALILLAHPVYHLVRTIWADRDDLTPPPQGTANDASRMNETPVAEVWKIPVDQKLAEEQLASLLRRAHTNHLKVSIARAQHSMGGHTITRDGIVIDMLPFNHMELDEARKILHVQSGARWSGIIPFLNARGLSVEVMQSNDDFSVGGSISVNCHGWQFDHPPIAGTVESFHLMLADGQVVKCSRLDNRELFSLALGGYGLFGIILDVDLHVVSNETYKMERLVVSTADFASTFKQKTTPGSDIGMFYGRLRITADNFLSEGTVNILHRVPAAGSVITSLSETKNATLKRAIFRGGMGSEYGKELRWDSEMLLDRYLSGDFFERNALLYAPVKLYQGRSNDHTDILMECFVPPLKFAAFVGELRKIIPAHGVDLMNLTVRQVKRDDDTFLRYADEDMFALVMLFSQSRDARGDDSMANAAREIIEAALRNNGKYYLPYRLHATPEQFARSYPQARAFFGLKKKYDPEELFQNGFYQQYGK